MRNATLNVRRTKKTQPETWLGFKEARAGLPYPKQYDQWDDIDQRNYERGRYTYFNIMLAGIPLPKNPITFRTARKQATLKVGISHPEKPLT